MAGDPRFFRTAGPFRLADIAQAAGAATPAEPDLLFHGVGPLQQAGPGEVSFLDNRRYADALAHTQAGAVLVHPALAARVPAATRAIATPEPYLAWARVCAMFHPAPARVPGCHPAALVAPGATVAPSAEIGPFVVIGAGAVIGEGTLVEAHAVIGPGTTIGANCSIGAHATVSHALLGDRVRLYPGARIGQDGFGFAPDGKGGYLTVPQLGRVVIEDDVEVGANTTIDRGSMHDTRIGAGSRIDNLVQIGHNVRLGRGCVIVAQAGISGSTVLGDHVMVAGQAGLTGHLSIGSFARIGAQAGVMADIPEKTSVMGSPCQPSAQYFRQLATLRRMAAGNKPGAASPDDAQPDAAPTD